MLVSATWDCGKHSTQLTKKHCGLIQPLQKYFLNFFSSILFLILLQENDKQNQMILMNTQSSFSYFLKLKKLFSGLKLWNLKFNTRLPGWFLRTFCKSFTYMFWYIYLPTFCSILLKISCSSKCFFVCLFGASQPGYFSWNSCWTVTGNKFC